MADINININVVKAAASKAMKDFSADTNKASQATDKFTDATKKSSTAFNVFAGVIGANVVTRAFGLLTNGFQAAVGEAIQFGKAIKEIETILPRGARVTAGLRQQLTDLSVEFGTSKTAQAKSFYQIISAGITDTTEATKLLTAANKLALGGIADVTSSINILTDIVNVYGRNNISAQDAADALFTTVRLGKTTVSDLASSMGRVLPLASQLGVSFDEISAALAVLTTRGLTTAERTTQLNAVFTALLRNGPQARKLFGDDIANAFSVTALKTKGLVKFLEDLKDVTGGSEEVLQKLLGTSEAVQAVLSLAGDDFKALNSSLDEFENKAGAADAAAAKMKETLDFQLDQLGSNIIAISTSLIEDMEPAFLKVTKALNGFLETISSAPNTIEGVDESIAKVRVEIEKFEAIKSNAQRDQEGFFGFLMGNDIALADENLKRLNEQLADLEAKKATLSNDTPTGGPEGDPVQDKINKDIAVEEAERAHLERMKTLRMEAAIAEREAQLVTDEADRLKNDEEFQALVQRLGQEGAIKRLAELDVIKDKKLLKELEIKESIDANKKIVDDEKKAAEAKKKIAQQREADLKSSLGYVASLMNESSNELFQIGKAAAIGQAYMDGYAAVQKALAQGGFFGFAMAAAVGVAATANIARIASAKPGKGGSISVAQGGGNIPTRAEQSVGRLDLQIAEREQSQMEGNDSSELQAEIESLRQERERLRKQIEVERLRKEVAEYDTYATGGIVPGTSFTGDRVYARVNSGEMILTRQQQATLFDQANGNAGNGRTEALLAGILQAVSSMGNMSVQIDGREIISVVRNELGSGRSFA